MSRGCLCSDGAASPVCTPGQTFGGLFAATTGPNLRVLGQAGCVLLGPEGRPGLRGDSKRGGFGLQAGLSCPSIIQNLCAWPWKAVTRHKMTRSLPRELQWWRNGCLKGLRPGTITGRTQEARHDLGTGREGKGKHSSAGPERCSPRRKKKKNQKIEINKTTTTKKATRPPANLFGARPRRFSPRWGRCFPLATSC